jgi:hypothetical protein
MAYFYSIRGWLEVEPENFDKAIACLKYLQEIQLPETKTALYLRGWCWQKQPINWTRYLFYGADVSEEGLELFKKTLLELLGLDLNLSGYFHAQGEDGENNLIYQITDDFLQLESGNILVAVT